MKNEFGKEKKKNRNKFTNALFWCWIICWFLCIWITQFRYQFFWTGVLCIGLACLIHESEEDEEEE